MHRAAPISDLDPFSDDFLADPFVAHAELRDAGPVVWLERHGIWAVARHAEVTAVLNDWRSFCSSRGVGLQDFARETPWRPRSLVLEADPPEHDRARKALVGALSGAALDRLRQAFATKAEAKAEELAARGRFDAIADLAEAFPLAVFPDALGLPQEGREHLLPYAGLVFNSFGPDNALRQSAQARAAPHMAWVAKQCQRENLAPGGLGAAVHAAADAGTISAEEAPLLV